MFCLRTSLSGELCQFYTGASWSAVTAVLIGGQDAMPFVQCVLAARLALLRSLARAPPCSVVDIDTVILYSNAPAPNTMLLYASFDDRDEQVRLLCRRLVGGARATHACVARCAALRPVLPTW